MAPSISPTPGPDGDARRRRADGPARQPEGRALHLVEPEADSADHLPVFEPLYSRSSIMTFVLSEVLLQALTLMNSPQQRGRRAHAETPRRLRRIVLTLRPACRWPSA